MGGRFSNCFRLAVAAAAVTLIPVVVWAAGGGEDAGRNPLFDLAMKFVNFGILAGALYYFLHKMVSQALTNRQETVRKALEDARKAQEDAEAKYREYQQKVANLETEVRQIRDEFKAEGKRRYDRILVDADQAADAVKVQAEKAAENEIKKARDELRTEAANLAIQLAEEVLAKVYTEGDQKQAVRATIKNIEGIH